MTKNRTSKNPYETKSLPVRKHAALQTDLLYMLIELRVNKSDDKKIHI